MLNSKKSLLLVCLALAAVGAQANSITVNGALWSVTPSAAKNAVLASVPGTPANITFTFTTTSALSFSSTNDKSVFAFFESGGVPPGSFVGSDRGLNNTLTTLTAKHFYLPHNTMFSLGHDDGVSIYLNGSPFFSSPGPSTFKLNTFTYTGPTVANGTLEIVYGECCTGPAVLQTNLPVAAPVPEPATFVMFGSALAGAVVVFRRKRHS